MFQTPILSVAIGLCFAFGSVALVAAALNEALASLVKLRGRVLFDGIKELLNRDAGLLTAVYTNALVNPRAEVRLPKFAGPISVAVLKPMWAVHDGLWGALRSWKSGGLPFTQLPSYIPSKSFTVALIDSIGATQRDLPSIGRAIGSIDDKQLKTALHTLLLRAEGDVDRFEASVADWFDHAMDRVSGAYKRRAQLFTFLFGLLVAVLLNVDATHMASVLWKQPVVQAPNTLAVPTDAAAAILEMQQLPVGWKPEDDVRPNWSYRIVGWLFTAFAAVFGAPFWFDLLQRFTQLRSTGPKPVRNDPRA